MKDCQIRYLETSHRSYCAKHQRDEVDCIKAENKALRVELEKLESLKNEAVSLAVKYEDHAMEEIHRVQAMLGGLCEVHKKAPSDGKPLPCLPCLNLQVSDLQNQLAQIKSAVCRECSGSGEIGLADGDVFCPVCFGSGDPLKPGVFAQKRKDEK